MLKNIRLNTVVHDYYLYLNELFGGGGGDIILNSFCIS